MCHRCHTRQSSRCTCAFWICSEQISVLLPRLYPFEPDDQISSSTLETSRFPCSIPAWETTDPFPQTSTHVSRRAPAFAMVQGQLLTPSWSQRVRPARPAGLKRSHLQEISSLSVVQPIQLYLLTGPFKQRIQFGLQRSSYCNLWVRCSLTHEQKSIHSWWQRFAWKENEKKNRVKHNNIFSHDVQPVWKIQTG